MAVRVVLVIMVLAGVAKSAPAAGLRINIIHTNDMHSRFEETSQYSGICQKAEAEAGRCYGGFSRMATLVRRIRASATPELPTFFLNAGDSYQGTRLYTYHKWRVVARFLNILRPDVVSLGNHEFDDGIAGLVPFLNNVSFPVVAANLDLSEEPDLANSRQLKKSTVLLAQGRKIGVIGYLTGETKFLAQTGRVEFLDEVEAIRDEAKRLKSEGCDIIIALGHSGFEVDLRIAREVDEVDLVIGGHTNTFLYNGPKPDSEEPQGLYPTVVVQPSGRKTYVVQAYAYTKYLGNLTIDFDGKGEITRIVGQPILVDSSVPMAEDVEEELKKWIEPLANMSARVLGSTMVLLQGSEKFCRLDECNLGNLIADAMIRYNTKLFKEDNGWTDTAIAVQQGGGIRSSISNLNDNKVTMDDVLTTLPFGSKVYKVNMKGEKLMEMLEWSVHDRLSQNTTSHGGSFLQMSGIKVTYDLSRPFQSRVVGVSVRCSHCIVPIYQDLKPEAKYNILITDYLYQGGDGFQVFKDFEYTNLNVTLAQVVADYINQTSPVYPGVEGRIQFVLPAKSESLSGRSAANLDHQLPTISALLCCFALLRTLV